MMAGSGKAHKMDSGRLNRRIRSSDGDTPVLPARRSLGAGR
jgi:hypothetical protein